MLTITMPAILFPAISLILLAYTVKLIHLGSLVRTMKSQYMQSHNQALLSQLANLRKRIYLIRDMQALGIGSFIFSVFCMLLLFVGYLEIAKYSFGVSLVLLLIALFLSFREIYISAAALKIEIEGIGINDEGR